MARRRKHEMGGREYRNLATEDQMEEAVRDLVAYTGGRMWHIRNSSVSPETADMPDLLIVQRRRIVLVELKSASRVITPGQQQVFDTLDQPSGESIEGFACIARIEPREGEVSFDDLLKYLGEVER